MNGVDAPRVMVICSHGFNHLSGTGVTLSNLFRDWPKDALAAVHDDSVPSDADVCRQVFELGPDEIGKIGPLRRFQRPGRAAPNIVSISQQSAAPQAHSLGRRLRDLLFGADEVPETARISPRLDAFIREFRPQVIYSLLGNNAMMRLVEAICDRYALPLVVHVMDDWKSAKYSRGLLSGPRRHAMRRLIGSLVGRASLRLGICDAMCEAYGREFGVEWTPFQNTVNADAHLAQARTDLTVGKPVRLLYTGSLLPFAQLQSLVDMAQTVQSLADQGVAIQLEISCPAFMVDPQRERLQAGPAISITYPVPSWDDYLRRLVQADILALPVNFDADSVRFIRYSMPTKVPEFLLSGVPILAYGPPQTAQIAYAKSHGWAKVVERRDCNELAEAIRQISEDMPLRERLVARARQVGRERHDAACVRAAFRKALAGVVGKMGA